MFYRVTRIADCGEGLYDAASPESAFRTHLASLGFDSPTAAERAGVRREHFSIREDSLSLASLRWALQDSGLSIVQFARYVVGRDERTVRRWLTGETEIPEAVGFWLRAIESVEATDDRITVTIKRS